MKEQDGMGREGPKRKNGNNGVDFSCTVHLLSLMSMDIALFYKCKSDYTLSRVEVFGNFRRRKNSSAQTDRLYLLPNPA